MPPAVDSDTATKTAFTVAPKPKIKQPPYPRPVPDIHAEEMSLRPDDMAFYARYNVCDGNAAMREESRAADGHDEETVDQEAEKRAAKRRRIESNAQAYLRGEPLYIMSAQLKGPFRAGWKNPWARKLQTSESKRKSGIMTTAIPVPNQDNYEIPATTTGKVSGDMMSSQEKRLAVIEAKKRWLARKSVSQEEAAQLQAQAEEPSRPSPAAFAQVVKDIERRTPKEKPEVMVEQWLRTNEAFASNGGRPASQTSPTPAQGRQILQMSDQNGPVDQVQLIPDEQGHDLSAFSRAQQLSRDFAKICEQPLAAPSKEPVKLVEKSLDIVLSASHAQTDFQKGKSFSPRKGSPPPTPAGDESVREILKSSEVNTTLKAAPLRSLDRIENSFVEEESQHELPAKADVTVEKQSEEEQTSQRLQKIAQAATNVYELRYSQDEVEAKARSPKQKVQEVGDTDLRSIVPVKSHVDEQVNGGQSETTKTSRPGIYPETSVASTGDMLPSAQRVPKFQHTESSGILEVQMLSEEPSGKIVDADRTNTVGNDNLDSGFADEISRDVETRISGLQAQDSNLASISYAQANGRTSQSATKQTSSLTFSGVQKVPRPKPERKRKRASFAPDAPGTVVSLKTSMNAKVGKKLASPASFSFSKENMILEASDDEYGQAKKGPKAIISFSSAPTKGILKSTNLSASPVSIRQSKGSLSAGPQPTCRSSVEAGQAGMNGDEDFDLGAAIDDLGSFLGSWSAEKEASGLLD